MRTLALVLAASLLASPLALADPRPEGGFGFPDLRGQLLGDFNLTIGEVGLFQARVWNDGDEPAGAFQVDVRMDGVNLTSVRIPGLAPNETAIIDVPPWLATDIGRHTLHLDVDVSNEVAESLWESNNGASAAVFVRLALDVAMTTLTIDPPHATPGQSMHMTVTLVNTGVAGSPPFSVHFTFLDFTPPNQLPPVNISTLGPGESVQVRSPTWMAWTFHDRALLGTPSQFTARAWTDLEFDADPSNNERAVNYTVGDNSLGVSLLGDATGGVAVGGGSATGWVAASLGDAQGYAAAAVLGDATAIWSAASVFGDATATCQRPYSYISHLNGPPCHAVSVAGDASGTWAVSAFGHAEGSALSVSGCDLLAVCADDD